MILNFTEIPTGERQLALKYDKEKISKLASEVFNALNSLEELSNLQKDDFLGNKHIVASAKYFLIVAIEASIDICNHIISMKIGRAHV